MDVSQIVAFASQEAGNIIGAGGTLLVLCWLYKVYSKKEKPVVINQEFAKIETPIALDGTVAIDE